MTPPTYWDLLPTFLHHLRRNGADEAADALLRELWKVCACQEGESCRKCELPPFNDLRRSLENHGIKLDVRPGGKRGPVAVLPLIRDSIVWIGPLGIRNPFVRR